MSNLPPEQRRPVLPAHRDAGETDGSHRAVNWAMVVVFGLIGVLVVVVLVLHLTGVVGPTAHG
jgi:hypothetical protein